MVYKKIGVAKKTRIHWKNNSIGLSGVTQLPQTFVIIFITQKRLRLESCPLVLLDTYMCFIHPVSVMKLGLIEKEAITWKLSVVVICSIWVKSVHNQGGVTSASAPIVRGCTRATPPVLHGCSYTCYSPCGARMNPRDSTLYVQIYLSTENNWATYS